MAKLFLPYTHEVVDGSRLMTRPWVNALNLLVKAVMAMNPLTTGGLVVATGPTSVATGNLSGDVTTSNTTVTAIATNAVTLAKLQQISTQTLLGRNSAGTGDVELVLTTQALDWLTT